MKHILLPMTAMLSVSLGVLGCGGDDSSDPAGGGGASCSLVSACGGALEGSWTITGFCPDTSKVPDEVKQICETATLEYDAPNVSGSLEFTGSNFTQTSQASGTGYLVLNAACLDQGGGVKLTCPDVEELINQNASGASLDCSDSNGGCRCQRAINQPSTTETGTFAATGSSLALTGQTTGERDATYCVQGDKLFITLNLTASGDSSDPEFTGQLQLEKK